MDTTEQYIKMLSKAREIQEKWQHQEGDYYFCPGKHSKGIVRILVNASRMPKDAKTVGFKPLENCIWLPLQGQLQEMVGGYSEDENQLVPLLHDFNMFIEFMGVPNPYHSMEQLWLGFVMVKLYGKIWNGKSWNGEDWIKEEALEFSPGFAEV